MSTAKHGTVANYGFISEMFGVLLVVLFFGQTLLERQGKRKHGSFRNTGTTQIQSVDHSNLLNDSKSDLYIHCKASIDALKSNSIGRKGVNDRSGYG